MKKINTQRELIEEKKRLQQKAEDAEKNIKESWKQFQKELNPGNLLKENIITWFRK